MKLMILGKNRTRCENKVVLFCIVFLIAISGSGCSHRKCKCLQADDRALASSWMHNAVEYEYINKSTYTAAKTALIRALEDTSVSASLEQEETGGYENLPPAVILDLDETVINNGPFQGYMVKNKENYNPELWKKWSDLKDAKPLAGAIDFLDFAIANGVTPIYVSNRIAAEEDNTIENLKTIGISTTREQVLLKNEHEDWTSDKRTRREHVARQYRILLLLGDDLNDFVSVKGLNTNDRNEKSLPYINNFGDKWFILPNPSYGSWEPAVYGGHYPGEYGKEHKMRVDSLKTFVPAETNCKH